MRLVPTYVPSTEMRKTSSWLPKAVGVRAGIGTQVFLLYCDGTFLWLIGISNFLC